jgi:hypothetical protein
MNTTIEDDDLFFFERHKQVFKGINAGEYLDKEDFEKFASSLASLRGTACPSPPSTEEQDELWDSLFDEVQIWYGDIQKKETHEQFSARQKSKFILTRK